MQSNHIGIEFQLSPRYVESYALPITIARTTVELRHDALDQLEAAENSIVSMLRDAKSNCFVVMDFYSQFFRKYGYDNPLPRQARSIQKRGFPRINPMVRLLLAAEMKFGVLMGVQDYSMVDGGLLLDIADPGEQFEGMSGLVKCKAGDMVIRDMTGVIASYFGGPDKRTAINDNSNDLVWFAFYAHGVPPDAPSSAIRFIVDFMKSATTRMKFVERSIAP